MSSITLPDLPLKTKSITYPQLNNKHLDGRMRQLNQYFTGLVDILNSTKYDYTELLNEHIIKYLK